MNTSVLCERDEIMGAGRLSCSEEPEGRSGMEEPDNYELPSPFFRFPLTVGHSRTNQI